MTHAGSGDNRIDPGGTFRAGAGQGRVFPRMLFPRRCFQALHTGAQGLLRVVPALSRKPIKI
jgi:hypothetical protein